MLNPLPILIIEHHPGSPINAAQAYLDRIEQPYEISHPVSGDKLDKNVNDYAGTLIFGGSHNLSQLDQHPFLHDEIAWVKAALAQQRPLLGICLGGQIIAHALGAKVAPPANGRCEFGIYDITPSESNNPLLHSPMKVVEAHYEAFELPAGATHLAASEHFANQAFSYGDNVLALQFHPEITSAIFQQWQDADWAMHGQLGAQPRAQQDLLLDHCEPQNRWLEQVMQRLFIAT